MDRNLSVKIVGMVTISFVLKMDWSPTKIRFMHECNNKMKSKQILHEFIYHLGLKKIIGTVKNYNSKFHTGKVCLYGYEALAEYGELDPECDVFSDETLQTRIGPQTQLDKKQKIDEKEVVFCATLSELLK